MTRHGRVAPALLALLLSGAGVGTAEAGRAATTSRNAQAYHLYSLAVQSLLERDYADAVALMEAAAQREPAPELLLEAARLHFSLNNSERAIDLAQLIVDGMPEHSGAHRLLGDISINLAREGPDYAGQVAIAEREYRAALESNPLDDETCRVLAEIYYQTGRLDQAADLLESFSRIADLDPKQALLLGKIYIHSGRRDKARTLLETVVARTPGSSEAIDTLAALYEFQGDFDAAIKAYDSLLMSGAPNAYLSERLGSLLVRAGRYEEAVILLEESRRLDPDNGRGLVPLAQAYQKLHDGPGALRLYDERLEREPADLEARFHRARHGSRVPDDPSADVQRRPVARFAADGGPS